MIRTLMFISIILLGAAASSQAQTATGRSVATNPRAGTLNAHHITQTGATVPNPGASQSGGTTTLDVGVQRRDDAIQSSICRGC